MTKHYDYIAIGGGSGGIASINRAAMYGQKCALIEAKELGGTCVNVGCVPKKVMWHAAQIREAIHMYGPDYGFDTTINHFDWDKLIASRTAYIDRIHTSYDNVLGKNNVDVIRGFARFVDAKTIEVNGETITADHILIATGGDQDVIGGDRLAVHFDRLRIHETGEAADHVDVILAQYVIVRGVNTVDVGGTAGDQFIPVEVVDGGVKAVVRAIHMDSFTDLRGMPHHFLRYTTHVHAGAAEFFGFNQRTLLAVHGCTVDGGDAAAAAADCDVVIMLSHSVVLNRELPRLYT